MSNDSEQPLVPGEEETEGTLAALSQEDLRGLAEHIVNNCPSLTQLLLAMGSRPQTWRHLN